MSTALQKAREVARECAGLRVRQVSRLLTRVYDDALRPLGIQESQFSVLVAVASVGDEGVIMSNLAGGLLLDKTTLSRSIVPLEKSGYVRIASSPDDARARVVVLTRAGAKLIEEAHPRWVEAQKKIRRALGSVAFESLRAQLADVVMCAVKLEVDAAE